MRPIRFTKTQRKDLVRLGLPVEVIEAIEVEALPWSKRVILHQEPRRNDVLAELNAVRGSLIGARDAIERLLAAPRSVPHLNGARSMIAGGGYRSIQDGVALNHTSAGLTECIEVMNRAIASVLPGPARRKTANAVAIDHIHDTLQTASYFAIGEFHPPGLEPSASPTSAFRQLIGICYEAIGAPSADPERALKAYLKRWRAQVKAQSESESGQNVPEKSDVPS